MTTILVSIMARASKVSENSTLKFIPIKAFRGFVRVVRLFLEFRFIGKDW